MFLSFVGIAVLSFVRPFGVHDGGAAAAALLDTLASSFTVLSASSLCGLVLVFAIAQQKMAGWLRGRGKAAWLRKRRLVLIAEWLRVL